MKIFLLLFIATFFTSCDLAVNENACKKPDKYDLANAVIAETAFQLQRDKNLIPFGTGRQIWDQIQMLSLTFICYKEMDIIDARELMMDASKVMSHIINSNEAIRPYLCEYPFNANHLDISIFFRKPNDEYNFGKLSICSMSEGKIRYDVRNSRYDFKTVLYETYEEAVEKLNAIGSQMEV